MWMCSALEYAAWSLVREKTQEHETAYFP
jgi:hypothetical protein